MRENACDVKVFDVESFWDSHALCADKPWEMALKTLFALSYDRSPVVMRLPISGYEGCFELRWDGLEATMCHNRICAILNSLKAAAEVAAEPRRFDYYEDSLKLLRQNIERFLRFLPPLNGLIPGEEDSAPSFKPAVGWQFSCLSRYYELLCRQAPEGELRYAECLIAVTTALKEYGHEVTDGGRAA